MDKKQSSFQEITYTLQDGILIHRLMGKMPELHKKYGLWIINSAIDTTAMVNGFASCPVRVFEFYSLSCLSRGSGRLWLSDSSEVKLDEGDWVLICPGDLNRYGGSDDQPYVEDSIRFCGPVVDNLRESGVIKSGVIKGYHCRPIPVIHELACDPGENAQINANISLQKLLVELYNVRVRECAAPSVVELLITEIKQRPDYWWTVSELAEYCQMSTDRLRRSFLQQTGMLPKQYIEELKMRQAAALLLNSTLSVSEVASQFGYVDPYHFSRRFKQRIGAAPEKYRSAYNCSGTKNGKY